MTKKKSNRQKRTLVGALCVAAVIMAGSTFAWFSSTDEVTNRLSASADYDVKIVESFAPPENWIPGQKVDKDVYAVNTGNVPAYAKATISGAMSITREVPVSIVTTGDDATVAQISTTTYTYKFTSWDGETNFTEKSVDSTDGNITTATQTASAANGGCPYYISIGGTTYHLKENSVTKTSSTSTTALKEAKGLVTLDEDERYAIEAGAYLALMPAGDTVNKPGDQVVAYREEIKGNYKNNTTGVVISAAEYTALTEEEKTAYTPIDTTVSENFTKGTDFEPHADGLYIFRRSIVVKTGDGLDAGTEEFTYDGYYFFAGNYYKITNLNVVPDTEIDVASDGVKTDGNLDASTTASLVKEQKEYIDPVSLTYDNANNRLVATIDGTDFTDANLTDKAAAIDEAEHELAAAELALREAMENAGVRDVNVANAQTAYDDALDAYNDAVAAYEVALANYNSAKADYDTAVTAFNNAKTAVNNDLNNSGAGLVGSDTGTVALTNVNSAPAKIDNSNSVVTATKDGTTGAVTGVTSVVLKDDATAPNTIATISNPANGSLAFVYGKALQEYNDFITTYGATTDNNNHIYNPYFTELATKYSGKLTAMPTTSINDKIDYVLKTLTYTELTDASLNFSTTADEHTFHQKVAALKLAKDDLDTALTKYQGDVVAFNNAVAGLGIADANKIANDEAIGATTLNSISPVDPTSDGAKFKALADARTALDGTTATGATDSEKYNTITAPVNETVTDDTSAIGKRNTAKTTMEAKLNELNEARKHITGEVTGDATVDGNLAAAQERYKKALTALNAAKANYNVVDANYANSGDIVIYINLTNDVLSGGTGGKWQILPTVVADKQAVFYYTSILGAGDVSAQLVDSVELADTVTQYMYKYFDFDLNVKLDSAQVTYDQNNAERITAVAANEKFDWKEENTTPASDAPWHDVTGVVSEATDVGTAVVTWNETRAANASAPTSVNG